MKFCAHENIFSRMPLNCFHGQDQSAAWFRGREIQVLSDYANENHSDLPSFKRALDCSLPACHMRAKQSTAEMRVRTAIQPGRAGGTGLLSDHSASSLGQEFAGPAGFRQTG